MAVIVSWFVELLVIRTLHDLYRLYTLSQAVLEWSVRAHFIFIEVMNISGIHIIEVCHDETLLSVFQG